MIFYEKFSIIIRKHFQKLKKNFRNESFKEFLYEIFSKRKFDITYYNIFFSPKTNVIYKDE